MDGTMKHVPLIALAGMMLACVSPLAIDEDRIQIRVVNESTVKAVTMVRTGDCLSPVEDKVLSQNLLPRPLEPSDSIVFFGYPGCQRLRVDTETGGNWTQQWEAEGGKFYRFNVIDSPRADSF
jgi:hypothetical protein